jgi:hypothetical protein
MKDVWGKTEAEEEESVEDEESRGGGEGMADGWSRPAKAEIAVRQSQGAGKPDATGAGIGSLAPAGAPLEGLMAKPGEHREAGGGESAEQSEESGTGRKFPHEDHGGGCHGPVDSRQGIASCSKGAAGESSEPRKSYAESGLGSTPKREGTTQTGVTAQEGPDRTDQLTGDPSGEHKEVRRQTTEQATSTESTWEGSPVSSGCTRRMPTPSTLADELADQLAYLKGLASIGMGKDRPRSVIELRLAAIRKAVEEENTRREIEAKEPHEKMERRGKKTRECVGDVLEEVREVFNALIERQKRACEPEHKRTRRLMYIHGNIGKKKVSILLDTGADVSLVKESVVKDSSLQEK